MLRKMAADYGEDYSPTELIDCALAEATKDKREIIDYTFEMSILNETMEALKRQVQSGLGSVCETVGRHDNSIREFAEVFRQVAARADDGGEGGFYESEEGEAVPQHIGPWLSQRFPKAKRVIAFANWKMKQKISRAKVCMDFDIDVLALDDVRSKAGDGACQSVRFDQVERGSDFLTLDRYEGFRFEFEKSDSGGWSATAYQSDSEGRFTKLIASRQV